MRAVTTQTRKLGESITVVACDEPVRRRPHRETGSRRCTSCLRPAHQRCTTDVKKTPEWLEKNAGWMRSFHDSWSTLIDNSDLDVDGTVNAIYAAVDAGRGGLR
jgi:hypothetical protein